MSIIGFINGLPVFETRAIVHDPHSGQFTSGGSGGSAGRNHLMSEHAGKQSHPEHAIKEMIHHLADKGSKVGKADASGKSSVHIDGEHAGHISSKAVSGAHMMTGAGKMSSGKTAGHTVTTAHHNNGSTTQHDTKKDAIRALAESHHHELVKHVEHAAAGKHAEAYSTSAHKASAEAKANHGGEANHLEHQNAADRHGMAAYYHEKAGNHAKAAEHKALKAYHEHHAK